VALVELVCVSSRGEHRRWLEMVMLLVVAAVLVELLLFLEESIGVGWRR
jgi:hypothetical protein